MTRRRLRWFTIGIGGFMVLVLLAGWAQDALYERDIRPFRAAVWEIDAAVSTGLNRTEYRELLRAARTKQLEVRADLSQWDLRRESWNLLNLSLFEHERAASAWDRMDVWGTRRQEADSLRQTAWRQAGVWLHEADYQRRTWWWSDLPGNPYENMVPE